MKDDQADFGKIRAVLYSTILPTGKSVGMEPENIALDEKHMTGKAMGAYGELPGHQGDDTGRAAAEKVKPTVEWVQERILEAADRAGRWGITADEVMKELDLKPNNVRPRFTELKILGKLRDSGNRRKNDDGNSVRVWERV
jgi:hypothetical protein